MKQKFLSIFTVILLSLSITPAFANAIGLRICVEGGPYPTSGYIHGAIRDSGVYSYHNISVDQNSNSCSPNSFRHTTFKKNKATFRIKAYGLSDEHFHHYKSVILNNVDMDPSCNTDQITTTRYSSEEFRSTVNNKQRDSIDWGFEYHLKVPTSTQKKTKLSCKIIAY